METERVAGSLGGARYQRQKHEVDWTETEVGSKEQIEAEAEQIVAEMVTGGADRGHLEQIEQIEAEAGQIEAEAEQIVAEMVTGGADRGSRVTGKAERVTASLGGADRSRDGHRRSPVSRY